MELRFAGIILRLWESFFLLVVSFRIQTHTSFGLSCFFISWTLCQKERRKKKCMDMKARGIQLLIIV